ncbi:MAG TPA: VOC family protein [Nocardioides sp.]|nr:VOC family protein [Nocardioides sp.]
MSLHGAIPAFPARSVDATAAFYRDRLGFVIRYQAPGLALLVRDDVELHLWESGDEGWRERDDFASNPVCSGAEDFIAGTASCRIQVDDVDGLYDEMRSAEVLHYRDPGSPTDTDYGTREFAVTDLDGNLIVFFRRR